MSEGKLKRKQRTRTAAWQSNCVIPHVCPGLRRNKKKSTETLLHKSDAQQKHNRERNETSLGHTWGLTRLFRRATLRVLRGHSSRLKFSSLYIILILTVACRSKHISTKANYAWFLAKFESNRLTTGLFRYLGRCWKYSHTMTGGYFKMNPFLFESPMIFKLCKNIKKSWYNICAGQCPSDCRWPARCTKKLYTDQFLSTMRMQSVTEIARSVLIRKSSSSSSNWHINEHKQ